MSLLRRKSWLISTALVVIAGQLFLASAVGIERSANVLGLFVEIFAAIIACYFCQRRSIVAAARERSFWRLWALSFAMRVVGDLLAALSRLASSPAVLLPVAMAFSFVPLVPATAALILQPESGKAELRDSLVRYDVGMMALAWTYLYLFVLRPWQTGIRGHGSSLYWVHFHRLHTFQDTSLILWLAVLAIAARGRWRRIYGNLCVAMALAGYFLQSMHMALISGNWPSAQLFESLLSLVFVWVAATVALSESAGVDHPVPARVMTAGVGGWFAVTVVLAIPLLAFWSELFSRAPASVREFRVLVSYIALVPGLTLVYKRQDLADRHRERFVNHLEASVGELRRLQGQFAEAEKLASLGQLAAGAAHEINNPAAAMLGYSELVRADPSASERERDLARKIGDQARRIRTLVHNLLSLAQQASREQRPIDVAALARSAVELRRLSDERQKIPLRLAIQEQPLEVRGDPDKLLQVFYGLLATLSDEAGGNTLGVTTRAERNGDRVVVQFIQDAPPHSAISPIAAVYDARRAAKGTGLGLTICYAIVREHNGAIVAENPPYGGRIFRVELPALSRGDSSPSASASATQPS